MKKTLLALSVALAATLAMPTAIAETGIGVGSSASASARLDFQVAVPEFLEYPVNGAGRVPGNVVVPGHGTVLTVGIVPPACINTLRPLQEFQVA